MSRQTSPAPEVTAHPQTTTAGGQPHERTESIESTRSTGSLDSATEEAPLVPTVKKLPLNVQETEDQQIPVVVATIAPTPATRTQERYTPDSMATLAAVTLFPLAAIAFAGAKWNDSKVAVTGMSLGSPVIFASVLLQNLQRCCPALTISERKHLAANAVAHTFGMGVAVTSMLIDAANAVEKSDNLALAIATVSAIALFEIHTIGNSLYNSFRTYGFKKNPALELWINLTGLIGAFGFLSVNLYSFKEVDNKTHKITTPILMTLVSVKFIMMLSYFSYVANMEMMQAKEDARADVKANTAEAPKIATPNAPLDKPTDEHFEEFSDDADDERDSLIPKRKTSDEDLGSNKPRIGSVTSAVVLQGSFAHRRSSNNSPTAERSETVSPTA